MNGKDLDQRLRTALEHAAPNRPEEVLARCGAQDAGPYLTELTPRRRRPLRAVPAVLAACLALVLSIGLLRPALFTAQEAVSVVSLDVNPSVVLTLDDERRVLEATAQNGDGAAILDGMDLAGTDLNVAVNAIIGSLVKNGYVDALANSILISVEDADSARAQSLRETLSGEVAQLLDAASVSGAVLSQTVTADEGLSQLAEAYGITHGKAALIQSLVDSSDHLTFDELAGLTINELNLLASSTAVSAQREQGIQTASTALESSNIQSTGSASVEGYIGVEAAQAAALADAGVDAAQATITGTDFDYEDGRMIYEVEFYVAGVEYEYDIDASTGAVLAHEQEGERIEDTPAPEQETGGETAAPETEDGPAAEPTGPITAEQAGEIALAHAGLNRSEVSDWSVEEDDVDGVPAYEVEFEAGDVEYDYEIRISDGEILQAERDE